jgi:hypothetical protein
MSGETLLEGCFGGAWSHKFPSSELSIHLYRSAHVEILTVCLPHTNLIEMYHRDTHYVHNSPVKVEYESIWVLLECLVCS